MIGPRFVGLLVPGSVVVASGRVPRAGIVTDSPLHSMVVLPSLLYFTVMLMIAPQLIDRR
jgi:hypothetical protein